MSTRTAIDTVVTERLRCERLRMHHLEEFSRVMRDPKVGRWIWHRPSVPPTEQELVDRLAEKAAHWERHGFGLWLLRDRVTGEAVGRGGLQWTYAPNLHEVEAAWAILPERWGQGLATELAIASVETALGPLGLQSLMAFTDPDNLASRRVMEKAGFAYEQDILFYSLPQVLYRRHASG
jgi:[ribosomal protein S5]-alanine N-acetyltransferase